MTAGRRLEGEDGVTLVELLTAITVSAVVLAFVTGTVVQALATQRRQTSQIAALSDARLAFERTTRDIRAANPLRQVSADRIELDILDRTVSRRHLAYARVGQDLVFTDLGSGTNRTLVGNLVTQSLFLFHLADGSTVTGESSVDPSLVRSITVRMKVAPKGVGTVVDLENRVLLRNARS